MARASCALICAASPEVPEHDDWTFDVGYRCPCIPITRGRSSTEPASTQSASTQSTSTQSASTQSASTQSASTQSASFQAPFNAKEDSHERVSDASAEPAWINAQSLSQTYPSQNANKLNPNVAQYKWQPTLEDGEAGMRLRKFLDANLAAETALTHGSPVEQEWWVGLGAAVLVVFHAIRFRACVRAVWAASGTPGNRAARCGSSNNRCRLSRLSMRSSLLARDHALGARDQASAGCVLGNGKSASSSFSSSSPFSSLTPPPPPPPPSQLAGLCDRSLFWERLASLFGPTYAATTKATGDGVWRQRTSEKLIPRTVPAPRG